MRPAERMASLNAAIAAAEAELTERLLQFGGGILTRPACALNSKAIPALCAHNQAPTEHRREAPLPAAQIPVVKPDRPMTIAAVDGQLHQLAAYLRGTPFTVEREAAMLTVDRLLDVRLAIMVDGEA